MGVSEVAQGLVISGMFDNLAKFSMPVIAFICIRITGDSSDGLGVVAIIGMVLLVGMIVLAVGVLRSEDFARRWGATCAALVRSAAGMGQAAAAGGPRRACGRVPPGPIGPPRCRWGLLTFGAYLSELSVYLVLLVSVRVCGVTEAQVSWSLVLASFALVRILQSVPITPGGIGVVELGLTGALVGAGGDNADVLARVLVYRALTWFPRSSSAPSSTAAGGCGCGARAWPSRRPTRSPPARSSWPRSRKEGLEAFVEQESASSGPTDPPARGPSGPRPSSRWPVPSPR